MALWRSRNASWSLLKRVLDPVSRPSISTTAFRNLSDVADTHTPYNTSNLSTHNGDVDCQVKSKPGRNLIYGLHHCKGRNARGVITSRHRGGGHKRLYRKIDFQRNKKDVYGRIITIEYDPNRSAYICLIHYEDGEMRYIIHPKGAAIGDAIVSGTKLRERMMGQMLHHDITSQIGSSMPLAAMRIGTMIHNIEVNPGQGGKLVRAAGTCAKILKEPTSRYCSVRLPSGTEKVIDSRCQATVGVVSNPSHGAQKLRKAGQSRWLGRRPKVRGVAMNPVDHPHGGGEGKSKSSGRWGRCSVTPWGKPCKSGYKTGPLKRRI